MSELGQLAALFLRLGATALGGPAACIAMFEDEVVVRRQWLSRERFLDLLGAANLIPGPTSTELAIHVGLERGGVAGLLIAGICFILPAAFISAVLAWVYLRFERLPQVGTLLFGVKPVVVAIILAAVWRLGRSAAKSRGLILLGVVAMVAALLGANELIVLLGGGLVGTVGTRLAQRHRRAAGAGVVLGLLGGGQGANAAGGALASAGVGLLPLSLFFLKVGSVLLGSGYVLYAFLQGDLVERYGWLTQQQLVDAIAVGQFTPGPLLSTATFIGYLLAGPPGAVLATVSVFAPCFLFVLLTNPFLPRLRAWPPTAAFLDAVNISAVGLMAAVTVELATGCLTTGGTWLIAAASAAILFRTQIASAWLIVGGAGMGWALKALGWA